MAILSGVEGDDEQAVGAAMEQVKNLSNRIAGGGLSLEWVIASWSINCDISDDFQIFSAVRDGTTFELETKTDRELEAEKEDDDEVANSWWSKEDLLEHLKADLTRLEHIEIADDDDRPAFEVKQEKMQVLHTLPNGKPVVFKKIMRKGTGEKVVKTSAIVYDLNAYLDMEEEPFDSTTIRGKAFNHRLTSDSIVPGLYFALLTMRKGEVAEILIYPEVAYGELGCPPRIPPKASIMYVVKIIEVHKEGSMGDFFNLPLEEQQAKPFEEILELADKERKSGNHYFGLGVGRNKKEAGIRYKRAIKILEERLIKTDEQQKQLNEILLKLYTNVANTSISLGRPVSAITYAKKALALDPNYTKGLYWMAKAKLALGDYDQAKVWALKAHARDVGKERTGESAVTKLLTIIESKIQEDNKVRGEMDRKMSQIFQKK